MLAAKISNDENYLIYKAQHKMNKQFASKSLCLNFHLENMNKNKCCWRKVWSTRMVV